MINKKQNEHSQITPLGRVNFRNDNRVFGIKDNDRLGHMYVIGKTGTGKSTLLENMAISDIERGNGICIIDPHGDIAEDILNYIPQDRIDDVIYFNPSDVEFPVAFNPLKNVHPKYHHLVCSGLISTFKKIWADSWGPRLEHILRFTILTLLEYREGTLLDIQPLLTNADFRKYVIDKISSQNLKYFWSLEFDKYSPGLKAEAIAPILNKVGLFSSSVPLRNIVGQKTRSFHMQNVMDEGKILICNLSKGKIGEDASTLIGSMIVTSIQLAALYRAKQEEHTRKPFYLYVDEAHSFLSLSFADILSEARKYRLSLFLSHQYIDQLKEEIRSAIFGNVGTIISFRIGSNDAEIISKEFHPVFDSVDLICLPKFSMYLKLMIDGTTSNPFSANSLPLQEKSKSFKDEVIKCSQQKYGRYKLVVEQAMSLKTANSVDTSQQESLFEK